LTGRKPRVVLVTGAAGGIGRACGRLFAQVGAAVALADLDRTSCVEAMNGFPGDGKSHSAHAVDVSDEESVASLVSAVEEKHGPIDVLVHAAAVLRPEPFLSTTVENWDQTFAVNARGSFLICQAVARSLVQAKRPGRIVLFASIVARGPARLNNVAYCASKAAVVQAMKCMALELAPHQITVNVISPGSTATEMLVDVQARGDPSVLEGVIRGNAEEWRLGIPLGRLAHPDDQAQAAVFLAGDAARHITGHELVVDGGQTVV
jgi:2,3-dihydro-2,3-dihydroxybenzoate dehydrogenase